MDWDKTTISFGTDDWEDIQKTEQMFGFQNALEASRFLFSVGFVLAKEGTVKLKSRVSSDNKTRYNIGTLDPDRSIAACVIVLKEVEADMSMNEIYEACVALALRWIDERIRDDQLPELTEIIETLHKSVGSGNNS